jgi:hypothetical protein
MEKTMKSVEKLSLGQKESSSVVEVSSDVDFVYIIRKDTNHVSKALAASLHCDSGIVAKQYEKFEDALAVHLADAFAQKGNVRIHIFESEPLEAAVNKKAGVLPIISLDPLMTHTDAFQVSRGFYNGGKEDFGQIARPGSLPLSEQAAQLAAKFGDCPVCVVEDDIFSGGSVISALEHLQKAGIHIAKLIPGFQIGKPTKLDAMGILVDPVISYNTPGADIFSKIDLGDPRDYLMGASGLVILLPDGTLGRAPYVLPFVSTSARASLPVEKEYDFAHTIWHANAIFFDELEKEMGAPVVLAHMDPHFVAYMQAYHGVLLNTPMKDLINVADTEVAIEQLKVLKLPERIVFLDVNGTLIPDDSPDGYISPEYLDAFQKAVAYQQKQGVVIGLCSDSPEQQLISFAKKIVLSQAPIIAENGNRVGYGEKFANLRLVPAKSAIMDSIKIFAHDHGFHEVNPVSAKEFDGHSPEYGKGEWAFGADRQTSVSVFGPAELISSLGILIQDTQISTDVSPESNFLGIHPGKYKENKGKTLSLLAKTGHSVVLVGNSMSDWVSPETGVQCAFVSGARVDASKLSDATYISKLPTIQGVIDILQHVVL